jgi:hypothetical protein
MSFVDSYAAMNTQEGMRIARMRIAKLTVKEFARPQPREQNLFKLTKH